MKKRTKHAAAETLLAANTFANFNDKLILIEKRWSLAKKSLTPPFF